MNTKSKIKANDRIGERHNSLIITGIAYSTRRLGGAIAVTECDCGKTKFLPMGRVTSGQAKSCGCMQPKFASLNSKKSRHLIRGRANNKVANNFMDTLMVSLYGRCQRSAALRVKDFKLSIDEYRKIVDNDCIYCGGRDKKTLPKKTLTHADKYAMLCGIDRIDSNVGYIIGNVAPCCGNCNAMKMHMGQADFIAKCKKIAERF